MINFFCSVEHAQVWKRGHQDQHAKTLEGAILTLDEAVELGRELWGHLQDERLLAC